jgi:tetratricopeptide (TPR) repeat protein
MNTVMTKRASSIAFLGLLCLGVGSVAAQSVRPAPVPPPRPAIPAIPATPAVPAPAPPPPPSWVGPFSFDFKFNPDDFHLDLDAIQESARQAVESARQAAESSRAFVDSSRAFGAFDFSFSVPPAFTDQEGVGVGVGIGGDRADALYRQARQSIDLGRYERAIEQLDRLVGLAGGNRVDAALYWKSYTLSKQGQRAAALTTLADLQKRFADSRWLKDARALEVEIRQASGQAVSPDAQNDEELKLLALRGLMQSDPDRAVPMIERLLAGNSSVKLQENALFVLSQSRSARAREIITTVAKSGNPDLQLRAIRYLGAMGGPENRQILDEVYRTSTDLAIKRAILRSFMVAGDRPRLLALAKTESSPELRGEAIQQLGIVHASAELSDLYQSESSVDVKKRILQAMFVSGSADKLIDLARTEKDPELRRSAIHNLGLIRGGRTGDALKSMYGSEAGADVRREIINALFLQQNAATLIDLARVEKDAAVKKEIVAKLSLMKSKEATDYFLELLK